ncbi:MAG: N-6 DNA methylase [Proteobacteria bacterium]|nr:N-6 DNA methylase [Pseudomonadota bacterium]
MALRRFALRTAAGYRGRDRAESFARDLIGCFPGTLGAHQGDGPVFSHSFPMVDAGKRSKRSVSAYWPARRVVVDVVERDMMLDTAWSELLRACLQMEAEPQYVVLTNQRDLRLYDLARDRSQPRLSIALDEIPKYSEAFPFFEADWVPGTTPKIINVDKVSKEVAELVAKVYRALKAKNPERGDDAIRFTLQCIVAMFSEDIGLLPKEYFTTLLYRAAEEGNAEEKLGELFWAMSSDEENVTGIPFFNGGLFREPATLKLGEAPLRAITKAAEANWTFVDPHIFGSVFQGIMDDDERHASGAHYTAREDIMSVVGPTIVEPWRERIASAKTLKQLKEILSELGNFRVLDPACGSGNFLYVAFRELYKLETEALCRVYEFASAQKGKTKVSWASAIRTTNFFGIDVNPFAVELAKTTLNIAKKIAFEERKATVVEMFGQGFLEVDPSLPLDNLDDNIVCKDALLIDWPRADAIVGNPPFLGMQKIREVLGFSYVERLREEFPGVAGDLCVYWFRRAHEHLTDGGRAGLIGTSGIRVGKARDASVGFVVANGGSITNAVSTKAWPGDAVLNVSVVNWIRGESFGRAKLQIRGAVHHVRQIHPHLQLHTDTSGASVLRANRDGTSQGVNFGSPGFQIDGARLSAVDKDGCARPVATGRDILSGAAATQPSRCVWLAYVPTLDAARTLSSAGVAHLRECVFPALEARANDPKATSHYTRWLRRWWQPREPASQFFRTALQDYRRLAACARVQARPIFFMVSTQFVPNDSLQVFSVDDDYSFGVIQSSLHWAWTKAKGGRLKSDIRYTSKVWKTFPWPQEPALADVIAVGQAAQQFRATRERLMSENGWSLRELYRSAEVEGPHPLKTAQAELDAAVEAAYGKPADQEGTEFLLEMNMALAEDEAVGEKIQGPGLPKVEGAALDSKDPRWFSTDCIEPPRLEDVLDAERAHG